METLKSIVEENIRLEILAVIWVLYLWELYLSLRQRKLMQSLEIPPTTLDGLMPLDVYQKARNYSLDKNRLYTMSDLSSTLLSTLYMFTYPYFWHWGSAAVEFLEIAKDSELMNSAAAIALANVVTEVAGLPFKIYETFVLEEKYGFNKQLRFVIDLLPLPWLINCKAMYVAFGFTDSQPGLMGVIIVMKFILAPLNTLLGFLSTVNSRRFEFQADQFAEKLGHGESMKRALVKMQKDNLDYPFFDPLYSSWFLEHPPLLERLAALGKVE